MNVRCFIDEYRNGGRPTAEQLEQLGLAMQIADRERLDAVEQTRTSFDQLRDIIGGKPAPSKESPPASAASTSSKSAPARVASSPASAPAATKKASLAPVPGAAEAAEDPNRLEKPTSPEEKDGN